MRIRGGELRGVLVPVGVAAAFILALAWYGVYWIPAQQRYLNESNLRVLRTMSAQIKARVDNFDQAIDHAIDSFPASADSTQFQDYVRMFTPELQILDKPRPAPVDHQGVEHLVFRRAGDPPRVVARRDEGRMFLYLGYYHAVDDDHKAPVTVIGRSDIEKVAAPFLSAGNRFDAVLLVDRDGSVIAQKSPSGIELARVDSLVAPLTALQADDLKKKGLTVFDSLRTSTQILDVKLGDAPYKLYLQPIQLSLNRAEEPAANGGKDRDEPEEWALCGLFRTDHFRAESSAISYTYVIGFSVLLALVFVAIPLLKLQVLSPRERLRDGDGVLVGLTTFAAAALLTFCVTDGEFYAVVFRNTTDRQLKDLAQALKSNLTDEIGEIRQQQSILDHDAGAWEHLGYPDHRSLPYYQAHAFGEQSESGRPLFQLGEKQDCDPREACKERLLARLPSTLLPYPFFDRAIWYDAGGWERIKWTTKERVTPFINLKEAQLPDFDDVTRVSSAAAANGIDVIQSPTTGEAVTVFWRTVSPPDPGSKLAGQWMSMSTPLSLRQPVLPPGVRFAVVDPDGLVLFHSDPTRSLKQNFFEETEHARPLEAAALGRYDDLVTGDYEGRRHRFHVTPIDARLSGTARPWSLIVFQDTRVPETVNLEILTLAVGLFAIYAVLLAGVWAGASVFWTGYPAKWFWPDRFKAAAYRRVVAVNAVLAAGCLGLVFMVESTALIIGTVAVAFAGLAATFAILTRDQPETTSSDDPGWHQVFCWARVSLIAILAVTPALACFSVACQFETRLLIKSGQASFARQLDLRKRRITEEAGRLPFCSGDEACTSLMSLKAFIEKRSEPGRDVYVAQFFGTRRISADVGREPTLLDHPVTYGALDRVLALLHRSYNDIGSELTAAIPNPDNQRWFVVEPRTLVHQDHQEDSALLASDLSAATALPGPGYLVALTALIVVLYLLVQYVSVRLFLVHLQGQPAGGGTRTTDAAQNVLLIGPPGSGKTARLTGNTCLRVVNVRTMAPVEVSAGSEPIGIDHFEYGFDDPESRDQMLHVLEELIYRRKRTVWVATTRDPWRRVQGQRAAEGTGAGLPDRDRWVRLFKSFTVQNVGLEERVVSQTGDAAAPYYEVLWAGCSSEERLALRQLAEEGVVNPNNESVLTPLVQDGLIVHNATFHVMNETFRRFILQKESSSTVEEWEREGVVLPWGTIRTTMITVAVGLAGLLLLTQQQLVEAWVGYIPTLAPAIPTAIKLLGSVGRGGKAIMG
jgi:hypothetical protein